MIPPNRFDQRSFLPPCSLEFANGFDHGRGTPHVPDPRVLILSASVGSGHLRAADALACALKDVAPDATVRSVDVLSLATAPLRFSFAQVYLDLIERAPAILGYIYNLMDQPKSFKNPLWYRWRVLLERLNLKRFVAVLEAEPWDLVINTFFLPAEIVGSLRSEGRFAAPQVMVVTDFETHRNWVAPCCDHYFTATEEAALYLQSFGVAASATTVSGIPVHPAFAEPVDRAGCLAKHGLPGDRPIVLFMVGGTSSAATRDPYGALLQVPVPLEIVVVTGRNAAAKKQLQTLPTPERHRVQVLGYTQAMHELLAVTDLLVTKPGGLTVSEALARGVGLVILNPIPGQEERNSDFLLEQGAAIKINHLNTLAYKVGAVLQVPERLAQLRANARRLGRPRAAYTIVERSLALIQRNDRCRPTVPHRSGTLPSGVGG